MHWFLNVLQDGLIKVFYLYILWYDLYIREDFFNIVKYNVEFLGFKNVKLKNKDIKEGVDEKNLDLITLDLPDPWNVIDIAAEALASGGFIVSYSPTIPQVMDFISAVKQNKKLIFTKTVELI